VLEAGIGGRNEYRAIEKNDDLIVPLYFVGRTGFEKSRMAQTGGDEVIN
jgi:hypothetical protein